MIFRFGGFALDVERFELRLGDRCVDVQPKVLETLIYLVQRRGRLVTKEKLIAGPWHGIVVSDGALSQVIMSARRTLVAGGGGKDAIRTVRGKGFRFTLDVEADGGVGTVHDVAGTWTGSQTSAPAPARGLPFVGREWELAELDQALGEARAANGAVVLVGGDAGIGKSSLVSRFADSAANAGVIVAWGHCPEAESAPAFWPWREVIREILEARRSDDEGPDLPPLLLQVFPELAGVSDDSALPVVLDPNSAQLRFRLFNELAKFLRQAASQFELALVLEDIHVGDDSSLAFLSFLTQRIQRSRLLVIATYRLREAAERSDLANLLGNEGHPHRSHVLTGLPGTELGRLVEAVSGRPIPVAQRAKLHALTAGNPFFTLELLRDPAMRQWLLLEQPSDFVPDVPSLGRVLSRRLARLPSDTVTLLRIAAVHGDEFRWAVVRAIAGVQTDIAALEPALSEGIVRPVSNQVGIYCFVHSLIREGLYRELPLPERLRLHARIAEQLEPLMSQSPAVLFQIADHHRLAAQDGRKADKAVAYNLRAAEQASRSLAYELAVKHYRSALDLLQSDGDRTNVDTVEVHASLGRAFEYLGRRREALESFRQAAELARSANRYDAFARAVLARFGIQRDSAMADDFVRRGLAEALHIFVDADPGSANGALRARLLAAEAAASGMSNSPDERRLLLDEALAIARRREDPATLAFVLSCVHWTVLESTTPSLLALATEMVQAARRAAAPALVMDGHLWQVTYLMRLGRVHAQEVALLEHEHLSRVHCDPFHQWQAAVARTAFHVVKGELDVAETLMRSAHELGARLDRLLADAVLGVQLFTIALQHREAARLRLFREAHDMCIRLLAVIPRFRTWAALAARAAAELGDVQPAGDVEELVEEALNAPLGAMHRLNSLAVLVPLVRRVGDTDLARKMYDSMLPFARLSVSVTYGTYCGQVSHYLMALATAMGRSAEAQEHGRLAQLEMARIRPGGPTILPPGTLG